MVPLIVVNCTAGSADEADAIAAALLDARLAACVQVTPVLSHYVWGGARHRDEERLLIIKTRAELFDLVCECIRRSHSYDVPEITAVPLCGVDPAYAAWVVESTREA